jgi:hypothetical protein
MSNEIFNYLMWVVQGVFDMVVAIYIVNNEIKKGDNYEQ